MDDSRLQPSSPPIEGESERDNSLTQPPPPLIAGESERDQPDDSRILADSTSIGTLNEER